MAGVVAGGMFGRRDIFKWGLVDESGIDGVFYFCACFGIIPRLGDQLRVLPGLQPGDDKLLVTDKKHDSVVFMFAVVFGELLWHCQAERTNDSLRFMVGSGRV